MSDLLPEHASAEMDLPVITSREGRAYVHKTCGDATNVTGSDLVGVCNPFQLVIGTICASCGMPDSTGSFHWEDTGEKVSTYRRRGVFKMPVLAIFSWLVLPAIGGAIGGVIGSNIQGKFGPMTNFGIGIGAFLMLLFIGPFIVNLASGRRILNRDR